MKRLLLAVTAVLVLALTACGSSNDTITDKPKATTPGNPAKDTTEETPATPKAAKVGDTIALTGTEDGSDHLPPEAVGSEQVRLAQPKHEGRHGERGDGQHEAAPELLDRGEVHPGTLLVHGRVGSSHCFFPSVVPVSVGLPSSDMWIW